MASFNESEESIQRTFEALAFQEGSTYKTMADFQRDLDHPRYKTDANYRDLVDKKLASSFQNNADFARQVPENPGNKGALRAEAYFPEMGPEGELPAKDPVGIKIL